MADLAKQLLQPVVMIWLVLIAMGGWQVYRKQYRWAGVNGAMVLFLFLFGSTTLPDWLLGSLEKPYLNSKLDANATADAVVVLGGYTSGGEEEPTGLDAGEAFDRILTGVELIRAGRAKRLYVGGGNFEIDSGVKSELSVIEPWLNRWNLTDVPIATLGDCGNTYGEARAVKKLMDENGWEKIFLVTSAWHMPRARAVFESSGVVVIPVGCDFRSVPGGSQVFFPQNSRLGLMRIYLQEKVGWMYYRSKGWIRLEALTE